MRLLRAFKILLTLELFALHELTSLNEDSVVTIALAWFSLVFTCDRNRVLHFERLRRGFYYALSRLLGFLPLLLLALLQTTYLLKTLHHLLTDRRVAKVNDLVWHLARVTHWIR